MVETPFSHEGSLQKPLSLVEAALLYAQEGWRIFPVLSSRYTYVGTKLGKAAFFGGYQRATTDEKVLRHWFTKHPHAGIGIQTGHASGIFVLDIDTLSGDINDASSLLRSLPPTRTALTGGGGKHLYFAYPKDVDVYTSIGLFGRQLDILGDRYIHAIAPPSLHQSGRRYVWENFDIPVAEPPPALLHFLASTPRQYIAANSRPAIITKRFVNTAIREMLALAGK